MIGKTKALFSIWFFCVLSSILVISSCQSINATSTLISITASVNLSTSITRSPAIPTVTSTIIPTLPSGEAVKVLYMLLKTNGNCADACFWGISPGTTTDKEVIKKFEQLGISGYELTAPDGNLSHYDTSLNLFNQNPIVISIDFKKGVVSNVLGEIYYLGKPEITPSDWQAFSLSNILKTYGAPSEVLVSTNPPNISNPQYAYALNYINPDLSIVYLSNEVNNTKNKQYEICPMSDKQNQYLSIFFFAGDDHDSNLHDRFLSEGKWIDISAISDLSSQAFYSFYLNANKDDCITIDSEPFKK